MRRKKLKSMVAVKVYFAGMSEGREGEARRAAVIWMRVTSVQLNSGVRDPRIGPLGVFPKFYLTGSQYVLGTALSP